MMEQVLTGSLNQGALAAENEHSLTRMLASMLRIGIIGFGGGNALVPVIESEAVRRQELITKEEYDELIVAANITPGALPVELAAGVGALTFGARGMVLGATMMALPGAVLTLLLLTVLASAQGAALTAIEVLSIGVGAFIVYLLGGYAYRTLRAAHRESRRVFAAMATVTAVVFALVSTKNICFFLGLGAPAISLSVVEVLALAFATLGVVSLYQSGRAAFTRTALAENASLLTAALRRSAGIVGVWVAVASVLALPALVLVPDSLAHLGRGLVSSLISFGGGDAYLTIADGLFVESGEIAAATFFSQIVPVVNILPGSILVKTLTGLGYVYGAKVSIASGIAVAVASFAVAVAASGIVFGVALELLRSFREVAVFRLISRWIRPIIAGLLLNVALSLVKTMFVTAIALQLF